MSFGNPVRDDVKLLPFNVPSTFDCAFGVCTFSLFDVLECFAIQAWTFVTNDGPFALILLA